MPNGRASLSRRAADRWERVRQGTIAGYVREGQERGLPAHLLAISAQQLLCTAPLAVALAAVGQRLTKVSIADVLSHVLHLSPDAHQVARRAFGGSSQVSTLALWVNLLIAVVFGVGFAGSFQRALELIWRRPRLAGLGASARQAAWSVAVTLMIAAVVAVGRASHAGRTDVTGWVVIGFLGQVLIVAGFVWWTQWWLLAARVAWRDLVPATALFVIAIAGVVLVARWIISGQVVTGYRAYGSIGVAIVLSAWIGVLTTLTTGGLAAGGWFRRHRTGAGPEPV